MNCWRGNARGKETGETEEKRERGKGFGGKEGEVVEDKREERKKDTKGGRYSPKIQLSCGPKKLTNIHRTCIET